MLYLLHVVLGYFHRTPGPVSLHALCCLLVPSRFLWSLVRGFVSKGCLSPHARPVTAFTCCASSDCLEHHPSSPFRVLRVCGVISSVRLLRPSSHKRLHVAESCFFPLSLSLSFLQRLTCGSVFLLGSVCLCCDATTSAECFEASLPLLPGASRAPRTSEPSRALTLLCLVCRHAM